MVHNKKWPRTSKVLNFGGFYSVKNGKTMRSMSALEEDSFLLQEFDRNVVAYVSQPFTTQYQLDGRTWPYTPDILVKYTDGSFKSIEVKPAYKLRKPKLRVKFKALKKHFLANEGHPLSFITEKDLERGALLANMKDIYRFKKRLKHRSSDTVPNELPSTLSFGELVSLNGNCEASAKNLLALDLFDWDMTQRLDTSTTLILREQSHA